MKALGIEFGFFTDMKTQAIIAGAALTLVNGAALLPDMEGLATYAPAASIAIGLWLLSRAAIAKMASPMVEERHVAPAVVTPVVPENQGQSEGVTLLGVFQEKGRLVDFLMDDIAAYSDAQVGAAARVVHQGCASALAQHFSISPVSGEHEGSRVTVPSDAPDGFYRLSGKVQGEAPFSGKLVHKGWKTDSVNLPRILVKDESCLPAIAPAQVEIA